MTRFQCNEEHLSCGRYDSGNHPMVEYISYPEGYSWESLLLRTEIILLLEGSLYISYERQLELSLGKGSFILLPPGGHFKAATRSGCTYFVFRINHIEHFCDRFSLEKLAKDISHTEDHIQPLDMAAEVENYVLQLRQHHLAGLRCSMFHSLKVKELFYLLRAYYPKQQVAGFLRPLLSNNTRFMNFVLQNYTKVRTVNEFAGLYKCSVSNFDKKFRITFGMSPYKWMMQKKINVLYNEINTTEKPFKQIAKEQDFLSLPQFTDYCKKHFGYSPSKMRKLAAMGMMNSKMWKKKTDDL